MHLTPAHRLLLAATALVFAVGVGLAIVQPGDLDDDETATGPGSTTTMVEPGGTGTTGTTEGTTGTTNTTAGIGDTTTSTSPDSGLGADGGGSVGTEDGISRTGAESLALPALALMALALLVRRSARPSY